MLYRALLKTEAKVQMFRAGFKLYGYTLFTMLITGIVEGFISMRLQVQGGVEQATSYSELAARLFGEDPNPTVALVACALVLVYAAFSTVLTVGYNRVCLMVSRGEKIAFSDLFDGFSYFGKILVAQVIIAVLTFFGTVFFFIPGIIASLAYSQTFFIMIDNPRIGAIEAMRRSRQMMRGHKIEYFIFLLSFFPWLLLTSVLVLAGVWVTPYMGVCNGLYYQHLCGYHTFTFGPRSANGDGFDE